MHVFSCVDVSLSVRAIRAIRLPQWRAIHAKQFFAHPVKLIIVCSPAISTRRTQRHRLASFRKRPHQMPLKRLNPMLWRYRKCLIFRLSISPARSKLHYGFPLHYLQPIPHEVVPGRLIRWQARPLAKVRRPIMLSPYRAICSCATRQGIAAPRSFMPIATILSRTERCQTTNTAKPALEHCWCGNRQSLSMLDHMPQSPTQSNNPSCLPMRVVFYQLRFKRRLLIRPVHGALLRILVISPLNPQHA
jgi:hypothetical protein